MQVETEQIVKKLQEKKQQREAKLKEKIAELTQDNENLNTKLEKLASLADKNDSEQLKQITKDLQESHNFNNELKTQITNFKQAYQTLQDQHRQQIETMQVEMTKSARENERLRQDL